jgi:hypothetical protein
VYCVKEKLSGYLGTVMLANSLLNLEQIVDKN